MDNVELTPKTDDAEFYIRVPLSCVSFTEILWQLQFKKRMTANEDKRQIIKEIESLLYDGGWSVKITE